MERDTPFETPWASNQLPNPRICPPWWLGRHTTKSPRHSARYSPDARYGEKRGPRIDRHPMGLCRCVCLRSSAATRTMISDTAVARSARNCAKKRRSHVFFLCDVVFGKVGGGKTTSQHHECLVWLPVPPMRACCVPPARGKGVYRR